MSRASSSEKRFIIPHTPVVVAPDLAVESAGPSPWISRREALKAGLAAAGVLAIGARPARAAILPFFIRALFGYAAKHVAKESVKSVTRKIATSATKKAARPLAPTARKRFHDRYSPDTQL